MKTNTNIRMKKHNNDSRITVINDYDRSTTTALGNLTQRQYQDLKKVVDSAPGYSFVVRRYPQTAAKKGSSATHIQIFRDDIKNTDVALVGISTAQFYDRDSKTEKVMKRIAHRVYKEGCEI